MLVASETAVDDALAPQPGGREPAPGSLAVVQAFINTHYDLTAERGGERMTNPQALRDWLSQRSLLDPGLGLRASDLDRALALREGLRALADAHNREPLDTTAIAAMDAASAGATVGIRIARDRPRFAPSSHDGFSGAIGALLSNVAGAMLEGVWERVKACPGRDCGWVFFDKSRNQNARWCAMQVCGDRDKARAYYARRRPAPH